MQESIEVPGYYEVPEFPDLLISLDDKVYSKITKEFYEPYVGSLGYYIAASSFIHRLKASAFIPKPDTQKFLFVNHKDGDKLNNELDNLEWCTASENCIHAYITGLRPDNIPVLVKDMVTNDIEAYYSVNECGRALGYNPGVISKYLSSERNSLLRNRYLIILATEEWAEFEHIEMTAVDKGVPRPIIVTDIETGDSKIYPTFTDAGYELGFKRATLYAHLTLRGHKPFNGYMLSYCDDPEVIARMRALVESRVKRKAPVRPPIPVEVSDDNTGARSKWPSVEAFCQQLGVLKNTVQKSMLKNNGKWRNYTITYLS